MTDTQNMEWWEKILGFKPEKTFQPEWTDRKCYNCESKDVEDMPAGSWTGKYHCNVCGYYSYLVYQDRMSGALHEDVAVDRRDTKID